MKLEWRWSSRLLNDSPDNHFLDSGNPLMTLCNCDALPFTSVQNQVQNRTLPKTPQTHAHSFDFRRFSLSLLDDPRFKDTKFDVSLTCLTGIGYFELFTTLVWRTLQLQQAGPFGKISEIEYAKFKNMLGN